MGTKANPGVYDCYAKLADDEPHFVLRAKDPAAPALVRLWVAMRELTAEQRYDKLDEAERCASDMEVWRRENVPPDVQRQGTETGTGRAERNGRDS